MVSGRSTTIRHALFVLLLAVTILSGELLAGITTLGSIDPPYAAADPWVIDADEFIMGFEADGTLSITAGSDVTVNAPVFIGDYAEDFGDTTGTLLITGSGSTFTMGGGNEFFVGPFANGYLTVADLAILTTYDALIGGSPVVNELDEVTGVIAGEGHVIVSGGAQWSIGDWRWLTVGAAGFGELAITGSGSAVTANTSEIGLVPDAVGQVLVDQSGSWSLSEDLMVGIWGDGSLMVSGGGQVQSTRGWVGGVDTRVVTYEEPFFAEYGDPAGTGHVVVTGAGSVWDSGDQLVVGATGTGVLDIEDGGTVAAAEVYIGGMPIALEEEEVFSRDLLPTGTGTVTVTGEGSLLEVVSEDSLYVGFSGTGTLNVEAGGDVVSETVVIGGAPGAEGTTTVTGAGSTLMAGDMTIGAWGTGTLTVADGAEVTAEYLTVGGFDAGNVDNLPQEILDDFGAGLGTGTVTVMGEDSRLSVTGDFPLAVGYWGTGTLTASAGGRVESDSIIVGTGPDATGTVTINGGDLAVAGSAVVGGWGQGNLTVSGGSETSVGTLYIGGFDETEAPAELVAAFGDSLGTGTVAVTGAGSVLDVTEDNTIYVGYSGAGTLEILNGGRVDSHSGIVGVEEGSNGQVTVDGTDSLWMITGGETAPLLSAQGEGEVIVSNGGQIVLSGDNGILDVAGTITVGSEGAGSVLEITDGADVDSESGVIGGYDPDFDTLAEYFDEDTVLSDGTGSVVVDGSGSEWDTEELTVGFSGDGALTLSNGGQVTDDFGWVGVMPETNGSVDVSTGSTWVNFEELAVGVWGSGVVDISGGSEVWAADVYIGGLPLELFGEEVPEEMIPDGVGTVNVSGEGSALYVTAYDSLYVGYYGDGTVNILDGGYVGSDVAVIALMPGSSGGVTVNGIGAEGEGSPSTWENDSSMVVGAYGEGTLAVLAGGEVYTDDLYIGGYDPESLPLDVGEIDYAPDGSGSVIVTGDGSLLETSVLVAGTTGDGGMNVLAGGAVESEVGLVAFGPDSTGNVVVNGDGSTWTLSDLGEGEEDWSMLGVGIYGTGQLTISNGGQVTVADAVVGGFDLDEIDVGQYYEGWGETLGTGVIDVTGVNSQLNVLYDLNIGHIGTGVLNVAAGGRVINSQDGVIGFNTGATGTALVTGEQSQWITSDDLYVGYDGTGHLTVSNGGFVVADEDAFLGFGESGSGTALVTGEGSVLSVGSDLYVGGHNEGSAGIGSLFVNDGGEVQIFSELFIWETGLVGGDGTITVASPETVHNYGTIAPGDDGVGTLTVDGSVVFYEGSTYAVDISNTTSDRLVVSDDVTIEGGTVQVDSAGTILGEHLYEIIEADYVTGEFDVLDTALLNFTVEDANLTYGEGEVWLHLSASNFDDPNIAQTDNQRAVAGALQDIGEEGGNDVTDAVQDLETVDDVRDSYDQLSGQTRPALAPMTVAGSSKFLGTVTSRVQTVKNGLVAGAFDSSRLMAAAGPDQAVGGSPASGAVGGQNFAVGNGSSVLADKRWGLWGRGYGLFGDRDTENGVPGYDYNIYGGSFGVDYQINETLLAGVVGGMSEGDVDFSNSRDTTDFGAAHIGLYGSLAWDAWNVDSVFTYAGLDYETRRFVDVLDERLTGNFDGSELAGYVEVSHDCELAPSLTLSPLASLQYTYVEIDSYTETGGSSALSFDEQDHESVRGSLGARLTKRLIQTAGDFQGDVQVRGRWVHEFGDDQASVDSSFATDPTVVFTVRDEEISRDSAVLGAGFCAEMGRQTRAYLDYDTRLNSDESIHVISASLQYRW